MSNSMSDRPAAELLRRAFSATTFSVYDRRSTDRIKLRDATLALAVECRERGMATEQATDEIRAIALSVGLDPMDDAVSDAVRWCIAHYFDLPLHD